MCDDECRPLSWALGCLCPLAGPKAISSVSSCDQNKVILLGTLSCASCFSPISLLTGADQWCELANGPVACFVYKSGAL